MKSYVENQKGYEDVELLEDCELYELNATDLQRLFQEDIHIANWGPAFCRTGIDMTEERPISRQFRTATERYKELLEENL